MLPYETTDFDFTPSIMWYYGQEFLSQFKAGKTNQSIQGHHNIIALKYHNIIFSFVLVV